MAKRELIDKQRILSERMKSKYYHLSNGDIAIPICDIEHAPTITEQDIVKPYLEELKNRISEVTYSLRCINEDCFTNDDKVVDLSDVFAEIDNLFSGQGDKGMRYEDIKALLKNFLMDQYDIRPSLAERTVNEMFMKGAEYISLEEQGDKE